MTEEIIKSHIKIIKEALSNNNLAIFVGSGVSHCTAPDKYPLWTPICNELKADLGTDENDSLKIAQLYQLEFKTLKTKKKIQSMFPSVDVPGQLQRKILDLNPHYIITTNWDKLFDNEINNNADLYDIIVDDKSLVESTSDCKYIKMHGDFDHNNYVFNEDDYINYANNFPLLENYIKSILSTHVVLFLGYSFNDIDLKQIENWIQNKSKVIPPIYMAKFTVDIKDIETKYLEKFKINVLPLKTEDKSDTSRWNALNQFLDTLLGIQNNEITEKPETFIYNLLRPLEKYPVILRRQIQEHLTNCGFEFDENSRAILIFYKNILTTDFNKPIRDLYAKFVSGLPNKGDEVSYTLNKIIEILKKADIHGIIRNDKDDGDKKYYFSFDEEDVKYQAQNYMCDDESLNFSLDNKLEENQFPEEYLVNTRNLIQKGKVEEAFIKNKQALQISKRNKDYIYMFVAMFNYKYLLHRLKFGYRSNEKYKNLPSIDLQKEFDKLPKKTQSAIKDILDFISFNYIYREIVSVDSELSKVLDAVSCVKNGGFSFSNDSYKHPSNHKNLIDFTISNYLLIENYSEYKSVCSKYVQIAFNRQFNKQKLFLNKYELFSCIKYLDNKSLQKNFKDFYDNKKWTGIEISENDTDWIINHVLPNCIKYYKETERLDTNFEQYIENTIFLLSMCQLNQESLEIVMKSLNDFVQQARNTIAIFSSINGFFGLQYKYNKENAIDTKNIIDMLNIIIDKFVAGKCNGYEYTALSENRISNLFGYMTISKSKYYDIERIIKLTNSIDSLEIKDQFDFCINLLFQIYQISDKSIKSKISEYVLQDKFIHIENNRDNLLRFFTMTLSMTILNIKNLEDAEIKELEQYIDAHSKNTYSPALYNLKYQIEWILKKDKRLEKCKSKIDTLLFDIKKNFEIPSQL